VRDVCCEFVVFECGVRRDGDVDGWWMRLTIYDADHCLGTSQNKVEMSDTLA